jgi:hypothetical protein
MTIEWRRLIASFVSNGTIVAGREYPLAGGIAQSPSRRAAVTELAEAGRRTATSLPTRLRHVATTLGLDLTSAVSQGRSDVRQPALGTVVLGKVVNVGADVSPRRSPMPSRIEVPGDALAKPQWAQQGSGLSCSHV